MPKLIESQSHPDIDEYVEYPLDDVIESAQYRVLDNVRQAKPARLTKLETLEVKAHELKNSLVSNWVDLADTISAIIDTDVWRESGYKTVRDYCRDQLGWTYEWCRKIINGAVAIQQSPQLTEAPSNAVATELGRLPEAVRAEAIKTITADDAPLTAERVRAYREVMSAGELPPSNETIVKFIDAGIERRVLAEAKKHSQPAAMLARLAQEIE